jgi:hypothetical protein
VRIDSSIEVLCCQPVLSIVIGGSSQWSRLEYGTFCGTGLTLIHLLASVSVIGESCFSLFRWLAPICWPDGEPASRASIPTSPATLAFEWSKSYQKNGKTQTI